MSFIGVAGQDHPRPLLSSLGVDCMDGAVQSIKHSTAWSVQRQKYAINQTKGWSEVSVKIHQRERRPFITNSLFKDSKEQHLTSSASRSPRQRSLELNWPSLHVLLITGRHVMHGMLGHCLVQELWELLTDWLCHEFTRSLAGSAIYWDGISKLNITLNIKTPSYKSTKKYQTINICKNLGMSG